MTIALSILIASRNRADSLARALRSIDAACAAAAQPAQIVVVDNGSTDTTAEVLDAWAAAAPGRLRLRFEPPGKSRALNHALARADGTLLAFTDDDIEVNPGWATAIVAFFAAHPRYAAAMGRVLPPPRVTDHDLRAGLARYPGAVPLYDRGEGVCDAYDLYGCNMVIRRQVFAAVGRFNEHLGPGASGLSEDLDLARRIRAAHLQIGYMPAAVVYHEVDPRRLTAAYYHEFQRRLGRSDLLMHPEQSYWRSLPKLLEATVASAWWGVLGASSRRTRAWGRVIRHAATLSCGWQRAHAPQTAPGKS